MNTPTDTRADHASALCKRELVHLVSDDDLVLVESCRVTRVLSASRQKLNNLIDIMEGINIRPK